MVKVVNGRANIETSVLPVIRSAHQHTALFQKAGWITSGMLPAVPTVTNITDISDYTGKIQSTQPSKMFPALSITGRSELPLWPQYAVLTRPHMISDALIPGDDYGSRK